MIIQILILLSGIIIYMFLANFLEYRLLKNKILKSQKCDLNICCGETDGGGINADIRKHANLLNFVLIKDIYHLPFKNKQFENVLCSHTLEHVENPEKFYKELRRIGKNIKILVPPLWDLAAALDIFEHKWIFLTFKTKHNKLPRYIKLPFSSLWHKHFGQIIKA